MLVLGRKVGEGIMIGDDISIKILSVCGSQIRIGIDAPKDVPVHRNEIFLKKREEDNSNIKDDNS